MWILDAATAGIVYASTDVSAGQIDVTDVTVGTALTANLSAFDEYELYKELSNFDEAGTFDVNGGVGFQTATVNAVFLKVDAAKRAELNELAKSRRLCIVVKDGLGSYWLIGNEYGAVVSGNSSVTGTAWNDQNSMTITFTAVSPTAALELTGVTA